MKDELISVLSTFGYPVMLQGSLGSNEEYPETFFTFWNNETSSNEIYDNVEHSYIWDFDVNVYSSDPTLVNTLLVQAKSLLKQNGFISKGKGYDIASDEPTHTGRGINVLKIEKESNDMDKVNILKDICLKVTGVASTGTTISEVLEDIYTNYGLPVSMPVAANQPASTADNVAGLVTDFNALLTKLKTAGLMTADTQE